MAAAEDELRSRLDSGEKLFWAGRPAQGMVLPRQDWYLIPFSVVWLGIVLAGLSAAVSSAWKGSTKTAEPMAVTVAGGLLFLGFGIYLLIGRFFADRLYRSRLIYGCSVTDPCLGWETTEAIIREAAALAGPALRARCESAVPSA